MIAKLSDIGFSCLAKFSSSFSHSTLKIIPKQLFTSVSVNIAEYLPRLRLGKYSAMFTSPSANNCYINPKETALSSGRFIPLFHSV